MNEETKTLATILRHQKQVSFLLRELAREFEKRADIHDMSKLELDELEGFCLLDIKRQHQKEEYGSKNYEEGIKNIDAVKLHQSRNSHHPEYWANGVKDMSFSDLVEMLCDWEIARQNRDTQENIEKTWMIRQQRFNLTDFEVSFLVTLWEKIKMNVGF